MAVQTRMTADEFLQLPESQTLTELIDGEIIVSPAPKASHQTCVFSAAKTIEQTAPDGKVYIAPIDVYIDQVNAVQPDILWNSSASLCVLIDDSYFRGAPDLVVEVLSPSTALRDKQTKFRLYEQYGVREYWIIEPTAQYLEVWSRVEEKFTLQGVFGVGETFASTVLGGRSVAVAAIFAV